MKRLREFIFDESLSEEEDDDEHGMGEENFRQLPMVTLLNQNMMQTRYIDSFKHIYT
jgi:hypothetical protein